MKVPHEKLPVYLISYLGQGKGNRTLKVPGTKVRLGRASKPVGPNTHEPQAGLASTDVVPTRRLFGKGYQEARQPTGIPTSTTGVIGEGRQGRSSLERGRSNLVGSRRGPY